MTNKELRKMYGVNMAPMKGTRLLSRRMEHFQTLTPPVVAFTHLLINDVEKTVTSAQTYDGGLGKGYNPETLVKPLPETGSEKWKKWTKDGYTPSNMADFPCFEQIKTGQPEAPVAPTAEAPVAVAADSKPEAPAPAPKGRKPLGS